MKSNFRMVGTAFACLLFCASAGADELQCGDTVTTDATLTSDLICPTSSYALKIAGNGIVLDGRGHRIVAPAATAGIQIEGENNTVSNVVVNGVVHGSGVFAYNAPGLVLESNDFSGNETGILLDADRIEMSDIVVRGNRATDSALFGIRVVQDLPGTVVSPKISHNDFSRSGSYAMWIQAASFELMGCDENKLSRSLNGIYLKDGNFWIHDLVLSTQFIAKMAIFVDSASFVKVLDLDVSTFMEPQVSEERIGLDFYRVQKFQIEGLSSWNTDAGLKLETEKGVETAGTVTHSAFKDNAVAGVLVTSYDDTEYGTIVVERSLATEQAPASEALLTEGTVVGDGSVFDFPGLSYPKRHPGKASRSGHRKHKKRVCPCQD